MIFNVSATTPFLPALADIIKEQKQDYSVIVPTQRTAYLLYKMLPRNCKTYTPENLPLASEPEQKIPNSWQKFMLLQGLLDELNISDLPCSNEQMLAFLSECALYQKNFNASNFDLSESDIAFASVAKSWPGHLKKYGFIEANTAMTQRVDQFLGEDKNRPICIAGFFGNVDAHKKLIAFAIRDPNMVILQNVDFQIKDTPDFHPQAPYKKLFKNLNIEVSEIKNVKSKSLVNLKKRISYVNTLAQAQHVSALIEKNKTKNLMVICPSLKFAELLTAQLETKNVPFQQTFGIKLIESMRFRFIIDILNYLADENVPNLLQILKNPVLKNTLDKEVFAAITDLEITIRRKQPFFKFPNDLAKVVKNDDLLLFLDKLNPAKEKFNSFKGWLSWLFELSIQILDKDIFEGSVADIFDEISQQTYFNKKLKFSLFIKIFTQTLKLIETQKDKEGEEHTEKSKSPVRIVGPHEARLTQAQMTIITDADDRFWPQGIQSGIPDYLRSLANLPTQHDYFSLQAQDFISLACTSSCEVIFTRSRSAQGRDLSPAPLFHWLPEIGDEEANFETVNNEEYEITKQVYGPLPEVFSATAIECAMNSIYEFYKRYILKLREIPRLEDQLNARTRGILIHRLIELYLKDPDTAVEKSNNLLKAVLSPYEYWLHSDVILFIMHWCVHEFTTLSGRKLYEFKLKSQLSVNENTYTIRATADLISLGEDQVTLIDFKTGSVLPTKQAMELGMSPQLPILKWLMENSTFNNIKPQIWHLQSSACRNNSFELENGIIRKNISSLINSLEIIFN